MTKEQIITELACYNHSFPYRAVDEAIKQHDEITPELLRIIENGAADIESIASDEDYTGHIFAMYLLAQFRETRAYPVLVRFFSADPKFVEQATGDIITEDLGRILASVCGGDTSLICSMVENPELYEYVRSAALEALVVLVAQGVKTRDEVMEYFKSLYHGKLKRELNFIWSCLVIHSCDLYAGDVVEEIKHAFADGLIDQWCIRMSDVDQNLSEGKDAALAALAKDSRMRFIEDAVQELSGWACYREPQQPVVTPAPSIKEPLLFVPMQAKPKVGRNEPCPCGSGKKYKKCCGA